MNLFFMSIVGLTVEASHFRAINYAITQGDGEMVLVDRSMGWRRCAGGYSCCRDAHVAAQTPSTDQGTEFCNLLAGGALCGSLQSRYIVTDIEQALDDANNFCSGYIQETFPRPPAGYTMRWRPANNYWIDFTDDDGQP